MGRYDFEVTLFFQAPAWDEKNGIPYSITAKSQTAAIAEARREAERDGHIPCRGKGRYKFVARQRSC